MPRIPRAGLLAPLLLAPLLHAGSPAPSDPSVKRAPTLRVGSLVLRRCADVAAYCGTLDRPLDPENRVAGSLAIHFEFHPHRAAGAAAGTLVATEGGPGYPATLSREDYLALFEPLREDRDVLLMDNRGTGASAAVDCPMLQTAPAWTGATVGDCGRSLGERAPFFGTAYAADDLAAILAALEIARIDLYGDSYGTYFEQVFALRHGKLLRSLVLDGAYPLGGKDYAWYPTYAPAMRDKFNLACARSRPCRALPGESIEHILPALAALRAAPFAAWGTDADGRERTFEANGGALATVMFTSAPAFASVRELDAAARAFVHADPVPLLRLMAETITGVDSRDPDADPRRWSAGLAAAVMCQDPPQIFDMRLEPAARAAERDRLLAERRASAPDTYAPFTIDEYRALPLDYSYIDQCVAWPVLSPRLAAAHVGVGNGIGAGAHAGAAEYPDVPALVLSGDLDNITTVADGAAVAHEFARGRQLIVVNGFHVNALPRARSPCAADITRRFLATLAPGDLGCLDRGAPLRLVPAFARSVDELTPVAARRGNQADVDRRKIAQAALQTLGDVLARVDQNVTGSGKGLRGGAFRLVEDRAGRPLQRAATRRVTLDQVRWTLDLVVSGVLERAPGPFAAIRARLRIERPGGLAGALRIAWREGAAAPIAQIDGVIGGEMLAALAPAP
jgi:pimeloyl-ACP methyl ester carboxylesterase